MRDATVGGQGVKGEGGATVREGLLVRGQG